MVENFKIEKPAGEKEIITEKEILEKLHLYHSTSKDKWDKIKELGAILSENELLKRGLIKPEQLDDWNVTSTGSLDREAGRDQFVFASHRPQNYGEVILEIDLSALNINGAKVAAAGDWLFLCETPATREYFNNSILNASEFTKYLVGLLNSLPENLRQYFWEGTSTNKEVAEEVNKIIGEGLMERNLGDAKKIREFWKLQPEIMFPKELPLSYIKNVTIKERQGW